MAKVLQTVTITRAKIQVLVTKKKKNSSLNLRVFSNVRFSLYAVDGMVCKRRQIFDFHGYVEQQVKAYLRSQANDITVHEKDASPVLAKRRKSLAVANNSDIKEKLLLLL